MFLDQFFLKNANNGPRTLFERPKSDKIASWHTASWIATKVGIPLTRAPLGYSVEGATLRGADYAPPPRLPYERVTVAKWARRQSKALNSNFNEIKKLKNVISQDKGQNRHFRLIGYQDGINKSCQFKLCQKASQGMKKLHASMGLSLSKDKNQRQVK